MNYLRWERISKPLGIEYKSVFLDLQAEREFFQHDKSKSKRSYWRRRMHLVMLSLGTVHWAQSSSPVHGGMLAPRPPVGTKFQIPSAEQYAVDIFPVQVFPCSSRNASLGYLWLPHTMSILCTWLLCCLVEGTTRKFVHVQFKGSF